MEAKYSYTAAGQLVTEIGPLSGMAVTNTYSNRLRVALQASAAWTNGFGYDTANRLTNVISPAGSFTNVYFTGIGGGYSSRLLQKLLLANGSAITNNFDPVARLLATHLRTSSGVLTNKHEYQYDLAGERTNQTRIDGITVPYSYDPIGQLKTAFISGGATQDQWRYGYDPGWDMTRRTNGTSLAGVTTYTFNNDNELTSPNNPAYDINGNLISYGNLTNVFDDENRLVQITALDNSFQTAFAYDGFGRLRTRTEYSWVDNGDGTGYWTETNSYNYLYDGWRVIEDGTANYTRGIDLSGTLEAAGGIGGLLARTDGSGSAYYHADGVGNITCMLDASQTQVAYYRYNDPYGFSVTASGALAGANVYRFSSKELHLNSGYYYYGYRFYDPGTQRWINRDPLADRAFFGKGVKAKHGAARRLLRILATKRPYTFVQNSPTRGVDAFGLYGSGYDAEECAGLQNEMEFLTNLSNQPGVDLNSIIEQLNALQDEYDENCGDDDDGPNPSPQPVPVPVCPVNEPQPARSFCQRHPAICTAGAIAGGTVVVVGVGILIFGSGGTAAPVLIGVGAAL